MSLDLAQEYKALNLISPAAITSTTSGTTEVEVYEDDCLVVANVGTIGANGSVTITVTGALTATPSTFDQTLATFVADTTSNTIGAVRASLVGIKTLKATATLPGSTSVAVTVVALVKPTVASSTNNSTTLA